MNAFGCGWYFMTDMFNHSCQPKCFKSVPRGAGGDSLLRTLRAVFPGEELTLDYLGDWAVPADRASRRSRLQRQFDFECACVLCAGTEGGWRLWRLPAASRGLRMESLRPCDLSGTRQRPASSRSPRCRPPTVRLSSRGALRGGGSRESRTGPG